MYDNLERDATPGWIIKWLDHRMGREPSRLPFKNSDKEQTLRIA